MDNSAVERRKRHLSEGDETLVQQDARRVHRSLVEVGHNMELRRPTGRVPDGQQEPSLAVVHPMMMERIHRPPSPPESECSQDEEDDDDESDDATLAGYEYCSREAIRYLMEEEKLDADHPVVRQLQLHLNSRRVPSNPGPSSNQE